MAVKFAISDIIGQFLLTLICLADAVLRTEVPFSNFVTF